MTTTNAKIAQQAYFKALDIMYLNDRVDFAKYCELVDELDTVHYYIASCIDSGLSYSMFQYHTNYNRSDLRNAYDADGLRGVKQYLGGLQYTTYTPNTVSHRWDGLSHVMSYIVYMFLEDSYSGNAYLTECLTKQYRISMKSADHISAIYNGFHLQDGKFYAFLKFSALEV